MSASSWTRGHYLILDTETTGLDATTDRVVELSAHSVDLATGTVTPVFDQLINPGRHIPPEASAIHHLVDADVAHAPPMEQVWATFAPVLAQHDAVVAHNAHFDRGFLPPTADPWICTLRLARHLWPEAPKHTNQVLRYWLGLQVDAPHPHRALDDTRVTAALFQALVPVLARTVQLSTPDDVERWAERPITFPKVPLWQVQGQTLDGCTRRLPAVGPEKTGKMVTCCGTCAAPSPRRHPPGHPPRPCPSFADRRPRAPP